MSVRLPPYSGRAQSTGQKWRQKNMNTIKVDLYKADGTTQKDLVLRKSNLLKELQNLVGGYIEPVRHIQGLPKGKLVLVNEEGLLLDLPPNPWIPGIVGNVIVMNDADLD